MGSYLKWITGGIGWAMGGPIGGILGFFIGSLIGSNDNQNINGNSSSQKGKTRSGDFTVSLLILSASIMKADGKILKSELDYVKSFLRRQFDEEKVAEMLLVLRDLLKQDYNLQEVCAQIRANMDYSTKLHLLHFLFEIAGADNDFNPSEINLINDISGYLGIKSHDFESLKSMFLKTDALEDAYKILEIDSNADNDALKKAYRRMALKYHPDKVIHLGEEYQKSANEKFQQVNDSYEKIKKHRGI
ncbi:MAG: hypothetical protein A2X12_12115 [Bacteroidetes bacterium GWE2_29_8]|nr:MAG: hypothetical protein A2X12_12115 [Bacteroidetes bacterium GWE2_29_8]OFY24506.1 MAG: hypothetical protein A2X02_01820 [Bacteroidetes bacterium GWF2_29_10]